MVDRVDPFGPPAVIAARQDVDRAEVDVQRPPFGRAEIEQLRQHDRDDAAMHDEQQPLARRGGEDVGEARGDALPERLPAFALRVREGLGIASASGGTRRDRASSISSRVQPSQRPKSTSSKAAIGVGTRRPPVTSVAPWCERRRRLEYTASNDSPASAAPASRSCASPSALNGTSVAP